MMRLTTTQLSAGDYRNLSNEATGEHRRNMILNGTEDGKSIGVHTTKKLFGPALHRVWIIDKVGGQAIGMAVTLEDLKELRTEIEILERDYTPVSA